MKPTTVLAFIALAALTPIIHAENQLKVSLKLIKAPSSVKVTEDMRAMEQLKGVDLLTFPQFTTRSGKKA
jgi:hypothetical protein